MSKQTLFPAWIPALALAGGVILATTGCDSDTGSTGTQDDSLSQVEDINDPLGGYSGASEVSGFGEEYLLGDEGETVYADPVADEEDVARLLDTPGAADIYAVRMVWGYLERDSTHSDEIVDWSGGAVVSEGGAIVAVRTIAFERRQGDLGDHIVRPRESREVLEWVSRTAPAFDGIQILVIDPSQGAEPMDLTITMPLVGETISVSLLDGLEMPLVVDEAGHEFRLEARKVELSVDCRRGWTSGRWQGLDRNDPANVDDLDRGIEGRFSGHWVNRAGDVGGTIRGFYGVNADGRRVMFGKLIAPNGSFRGLVRGLWDPAGDSPGHGSFRAQWLNAEREEIGGMRGVWEHRRDGRGFFHGAWATSCGGDADEGEVDIDPAIFAD